MAKTDPVVEQMNSFALALLEAAREAKVETAAKDGSLATDHLSIAERVGVFREVAKWISIKNRLPEPAEGGDLDEYRARLGQPPAVASAREQARALVERGQSIADRAVYANAPAPVPAAANASATAPVAGAAAVGTPRKAFNPDGTNVRGNPVLRPIDEAGGGPDLDALRARLPSAGGGDAGGVLGDRGGAAHPLARRPRGFRGGGDGVARSERDDAGGRDEL